MVAFRAALALALAAGCDAAISADLSQVVTQNSMNPIRKVVTLLQAMQKKVTEEGEKEKQLYEKFMCHCKTGTAQLSTSIADAESKVPAVGSEIETAEEQLEQAKADLKGAQIDREAAQVAIEEAKGLREKEAASFAAYKADADTNIGAITKAVAALSKGMTGFLQTDTKLVQVLRRLAGSEKFNFIDQDRQDLLAFLAQNADYAPQSGEVTGILKEMGDTMAKDLADATAAEEASIKSFTELVAAKDKEIAALSNTVETKTGQIGELGVQIVQMKEDLSDTQAALLEDRKYSQELETGCQTKTGEWEERSKTRAEELVALADTIKVLNDDDALDLFKKTLPAPASASLVQVRVSGSDQRDRVVDLLRGARKSAPVKSRPALDLIALALSGKKGTGKGQFDQVLKMVDEMVVILKREQEDDDHKKEYCGGQFDAADDKKKALEHKVADAEAAVGAAKDGIEVLSQEIAALEAGIVALDKSVAAATEQRKAENAEFQELMASDSAAKDLLNFAKNRLNKFYSPNLYKAPAKQELSAEERIFVNNGGTPPPTEAPGGIAGTGVAVFAQISVHNHRAKEAPAPPPETWGAYQSKSGESNGVIGMIDLLIKDLAKEMTEAEAEEKEATKDYEALMGDAAAKRAADTTSLAEKSSAKADLEGELQAQAEVQRSGVDELMATEKYIGSLHAECDWLLQNYDVRKTARADEVDSLGRAKAILSGADYSLLQTHNQGFLGRRL